MYGIDNFNVESVLDKFREVESGINEIYKSLPSTVGCMKNIEDAKNSCGAWCCEEQNPSVWFCEFLNTLSSFMFKMDPVDFSKLIELCLKKYLLIDKGGGCVFWDSDTKLCKQHESRPINCYFYGVTPKEEFEPRYKRLKVLN
nr:YkgJ family cysteine cluster protein [Pelagibacterales bacterium]